MYKGANRNYKQVKGNMNLTDKYHFASSREDGRHTATLAALLEMMRQRNADLKLPDKLDSESFYKWQADVKERTKLLLNLPNVTKQPEPIMLWCKQKDGYRAEKWEYYPDSYTAVPFIATVKRAYDFCGASDNLIVDHYTYYADPSKRKARPDVPLRGLSADEMLRDYMYVDDADHSFRQGPALRLLKRAFDME